MKKKKKEKIENKESYINPIPTQGPPTYEASKIIKKTTLYGIYSSNDPTLNCSLLKY